MQRAGSFENHINIKLSRLTRIVVVHDGVDEPVEAHDDPHALAFRQVKKTEVERCAAVVQELKPV